MTHALRRLIYRHRYIETVSLLLGSAETARVSRMGSDALVRARLKLGRPLENLLLVAVVTNLSVVRLESIALGQHELRSDASLVWLVELLARKANLIDL